MIGLPTECSDPDSSSLASAAEALGLGGEGDVTRDGDIPSERK